MQISDLSEDDPDALEQAAQVLLAAFRGTTPAWPELPAARAEVRECLREGGLCRVARDGEGRVLGWVGGISTYDGRVWEVHPLAVDPAHQRRGVGRALLADLEALAAARGGLTLLVGTDDEVARTSLGGADPYPDLLGALAGIRDLGAHPYRFYQRCGFSLAGVIPDANGRGKPDILMAKRIPSPADATRPAGIPHRDV